ECSMIAITDGEALLFFPPSRDHKRIGDGDTGPNTGGMGAFSPVPDVSDALREQIEREVFIPLLHGLKREGITFRGCLYAGLMLTKSGPRVLEWNVRFGDPETQVILPRYEGDLLVALHAAATGTLSRVQQAGFGRPAVSVVCAAAGYPASARKGDVITGIADAETDEDVVVFQAGTKAEDGGLVTNGGRVLAVTARGDTLADAKAKAYAGVAKIEWAGKTTRSDIGSSI
ncbi:MAG: phosphoribosylamine--glycine ligase, partial [Planctomycetota bacterium]